MTQAPALEDANIRMLACYHCGGISQGALSEALRLVDKSYVDAQRRWLDCRAEQRG